MNRRARHSGEFLFQLGARRYMKQVKPAKQHGAKAPRQAFTLAEVNDVKFAIIR